MKVLLKTIVALGAAAMMAMSPALADDLGIFQTTDRKMDFELTICGNGKDLCVKLLAARGSAATKAVKPYIGKLVVNKAKPTGTNAWRGTFKQGDLSVNGSMKLSPGKSFKISGCSYIVVCGDFNLIPAK